MSRTQAVLRRLLKQPGAPRVLTTPMLARLASQAREGVSRGAVALAVRRLEEDGDLRKVSRGLYLNRCLVPPAAPAEAVAYLRRGAVVSLHSVLGDAGILNNYTNDVWCVVPIQDPPVSVRSVTAADGTRFHFRGIRAERLFAPDRKDLFAAAPYPRATSEAALCHWLYLWHQPRSGLGPLPQDLDLEELDLARAERIASAMGIEATFTAWRDTVDLDYEQDVSPGLGF